MEWNRFDIVQIKGILVCIYVKCFKKVERIVCIQIIIQQQK